jgi:hypothetical protein
LFACLVLLDGLFSRRRHAASHVALCRDGGGRFFLLDWPALEPQSTGMSDIQKEAFAGRANAGETAEYIDLAAQRPILWQSVFRPEQASFTRPE